MPKAILFDADGVVIRAREKYFSDRIAEEAGVPVVEILPFYKNEMRQAFVNKLDIKDALPPYLAKLHWRGSVEDFLVRWFGEESPRDEDVIAYIQELRKKGYKCFLATDREKYWAEYLKKTVGLEKDFDGFMFSYELGHEKNEPGFYTEATQKLGLKPEEIMFWEDDPKNVAVAKSAGIDARLYTNLGEMKKIGV